MRASKKFILTLALAAVAYVLAQFYVDLPPRSIALDKSESWVAIEDQTASVRAALTYVCTSWRFRRTSVYLPLNGPVTELTARVESPSTWRQYPDGVVLFLAMQPNSRQTAEFSFRQPVSGRYVYTFTQARGWPFPPNLQVCHLDLPAGAQLNVQPDTTSTEGDRVLMTASGSGIEVTW